MTSDFQDPKELFLEHYRYPRNRQLLAVFDGIGSVKSPTGASLTISLVIDRVGDEPRIARIGFQSQRCGIAVAYVSLLTELVFGQPLSVVHNFRPEDLMIRFGKGACALEPAVLSIEALRRALKSLDTK